MIFTVAEMLNQTTTIRSRAANRFITTQPLLRKATMVSILTTLTNTIIQTLMAFSSLCLTRVTLRLQFLIWQCLNRATIISPIILEVHSKCIRCPYPKSILRLISISKKAEELISCRQTARHRPSKVSTSLQTKTSILQCHWCWTICLWPRLSSKLLTAPHPRQEAQTNHLKEKTASTTLKTRISMLIPAAAMVAPRSLKAVLSFSAISPRGSALFKKA